jgi:hypothetical protein
VICGFDHLELDSPHSSRSSSWHDGLDLWEPQRPTVSLGFCGSKNIPPSLMVSVPTFLDVWFLLAKDWLEKTLKDINQMLGTEDQLSMKEFQSFFGIYICMRLAPLSDLRDHWKKGSNIYSSNFIRTTMSQKRWEQIHYYIKKSLDLVSMVSTLNESFNKYWQPFPQLTLDDGYPDYTGRSAYVQRRPRKPKEKGKKSSNFD